MKKIVLSVILLWVFCASTTMANDCLSYVREVYKAMNFPQQSIDKKSCYYIKYSLRTTMRDTTIQKNSAITTEVFVKDQIMRVVSDQIRIYQDANDIVAITANNKSILLRSTIAVEDPPKTQERFLFFQDTVFACSTVLSCTDKTIEGKRVKDIHIKIRKQAQHLFPFYRMRFVIDTQSKQLQQLFLEYKSSQAIKSVEVNYHTIDYRHRSPEDFEQPALSFVMTSSKKVRPEFKNYKIVDVRKSATR